MDAEDEEWLDGLDCAIDSFAIKDWRAECRKLMAKVRELDIALAKVVVELERKKASTYVPEVMETITAYQRASIVEQEAHQKAEAENEKLRGALPDPDKLHILADWIDVREADDEQAGVEVQLDLRRWARLATAALKGDKVDNEP